MAQRKERHMFPGGNTYRGFFSYYDHILPQDRAERIFILKGGPGVGKSTLMKSIATEISGRGYETEYMHCSSDPDSLDGVVFPALKVALLDGTAPHVVDPKNPGAVDEIINLGEFWEEKGLIENKEKIMRINREIRRRFERAYRYLQAAYHIYRDNEVLFEEAVNRGSVHVCMAAIQERIFEGIAVSEIEGRRRRLFASAITPKGFVNYLSSLITTDEVIILRGNPGTGTERILERVAIAASERGIDTEGYYCAMNPYKMEHLIIPELQVSLTTENSVHAIDREATLIMDLNAYLESSITERCNDVIRFNREEVDRLSGKAIESIRQAKAYHDELESFYVPNMNFNGVEKCRENILARLLESIQTH